MKAKNGVLFSILMFIFSFIVSGVFNFCAFHIVKTTQNKFVSRKLNKPLITSLCYFINSNYFTNVGKILKTFNDCAVIDE